MTITQEDRQRAMGTLPNNSSPQSRALQGAWLANRAADRAKWERDLVDSLPAPDDGR